MDSPNGVLANVLARPRDLLAPSLRENRPDSIVLDVGAQLNAPPHLGTCLVLACAFVLGQDLGEPARVRFTALDNAPHEQRDGYQRSVHHAIGAEGVADLIERHYRRMLETFTASSGVPYELLTYTEVQRSRDFRREFLLSLRDMDRIRWALSPSVGRPHLRLPCPACGWADKRAERTQIRTDGVIEAVCPGHGSYRVTVTEEPRCYVDLATLYRNYVKERQAQRRRETLSVMIKGADWALASPLVDRALAEVGVLPPPRVFCPMVLTSTGAKLAKSHGVQLAPPADPAAVLGVARSLLAHPRHFFRNFTVQELNHLMAATRTWDLSLYRDSFDLVSSGRKHVEVRVSYPKFHDMAPGHRIRFTSEGVECLTRVERVARYSSFEELLDAEGAERVNPDFGRDEQLKRIRSIYPPEKEALGPLAIELTLLRDQ